MLFVAEEGAEVAPLLEHVFGEYGGAYLNSGGIVLAELDEEGFLEHHQALGSLSLEVGEHTIYLTLFFSLQLLRLTPCLQGLAEAVFFRNI